MEPVQHLIYQLTATYDNVIGKKYNQNMVGLV